MILLLNNSKILIISKVGFTVVIFLIQYEPVPPDKLLQLRRKGNIMKKTKFVITLLMAVLMTFSSAFCVSVSAASSPDEAVISGNYDGIEPIPTEKPEDKPVKHGKGFSSGDYALFYTQTTFLALLAGYLIIFKVKGTKTKEKMHRRKLDRK